VPGGTSDQSRVVPVPGRKLEVASNAGEIAREGARMIVEWYVDLLKLYRLAIDS
jgi:hypothetical protein